MKIQGQQIEGPNIDYIVLPRGAGKDNIIFKIQAVLDDTEFKQLCPEPTPPKKRLATGQEVSNIYDPTYQKALEQHADRRIDWLCLKSLQATEGLEWETVDMSDPSTWPLYKQELRNSGFSLIEVNRIIAKCFAVNALSEAHIMEAEKLFLLGLQARQNE